LTLPLKLRQQLAGPLVGLGAEQLGDAGLSEPAQVLGRHRPAVQVALGVVAAMGHERGRLVLFFYAFSDHCPA